MGNEKKQPRSKLFSSYYTSHYTNGEGTPVDVVVDTEYKKPGIFGLTDVNEGEIPTDTLLHFRPLVKGGLPHKVRLSGPDSSVRVWNDHDGEYYNSQYSDYWIPRAREIEQNVKRVPSVVEKLWKRIGFKQQGGQINKYYGGGPFGQELIMGTENHPTYFDGPALSSSKPATFNPNAGRQEAYNSQWEARRKELAQGVLNGSTKKVNMRREKRRFQRNFDRTWDSQELSRKAQFDIANGPASQLKATPVNVPQKPTTYFDSASPTAAPSNEALGQKTINNQTDAKIAAQNAAFAKKRKLDEYYLAEARKYGFDSLEAVKKWQSQQKGLVADGYFGPKSLAMWNSMKPQQSTPEMFVNPFAPKVSTKDQMPASMVATNGGYTEDDPRAGVKTFKPVYDDFVDANGNIVRGYKDETGKIILSQKTGGIMNKYQQGGVAPQQDIQQQVKQLVKAAVVQKNPEAVKQIKQIIEAAQQGDEQAIQIATLIQQEMESVQKAEQGAKINYLKKLKGQCPEGEELVYFKKGGMLSCGCQKKQNGGEVKKPKENKKSNPIEEFKKSKKLEEGGLVENNQNSKRHANIASNYFNATPTITNLAKGAYHWLRSRPTSELIEAATFLIPGTGSVKAGATAVKAGSAALKSAKAAKVLKQGKNGSNVAKNLAKKVHKKMGSPYTEGGLFYHADGTWAGGRINGEIPKFVDQIDNAFLMEGM